ncbi:60S ribosomal export protein NMD3 [Tetranychus urticae]|uniref:60S ribosomal export protein NMD3 n=1 Tax=Tetranychus urticae TaxID=32264 RepID=T1K910_TETUR|nr:60S ribosomal export protein NMD3 [Tetranychus urticae]
MEYLPADEITQTQVKILCCVCGVLIDTNPSNMCAACLKSNFDITKDIPKSSNLYFCRGCERYQHSQGNWIYCELESRELLTLCLKKLKNLSKVHLTDASFVWTEPHSKRLKVKLTVQQEVDGGTILQQVFIVEYVVNNQFCDACHRREAKDFWRASVQVRQKVGHKKTFFYLEQLILKHKAHTNAVSVKATTEGVDFFFDKKDDARKFVDFLQNVVPCRYIPSQQLISHDTHNNTYTYKHSFSVEIVPICKDDLVCLPPALAASLGNIGPLCLCLRVTNNIYLLDPFTLRHAELSNQNYWRYPFKALASTKQLTEYTVISIDIINRNQIPGHQKAHLSSKHMLADAYVQRSCNLGSNEDEIHTRTHLGHLLSPLDRVLGYDMGNANWNDTYFEKFEDANRDNIPDVILVKKFFGDRAIRKRLRRWKLKRIEVIDETASSEGGDIAEFMDDLEEDPMLRENVNVYIDKKKIASEMAVDVDDLEHEGIPQITLQEMLEDLDIDDE